MSRTAWLSSVDAPNGYNGHRAAQHLCHDPVSGILYIVWQTANGDTGYFTVAADCAAQHLAWVDGCLADGRMELLSGPMLPAAVA